MNKIGLMGENEACKYIKRLGYRILKRNHREGSDEIDIIAREKDCTLVFIEVKTLLMVEKSQLVPEDNFTKQKSKKVNRACRSFASKHAEFIDERRGWRIDLIAIEFSSENKFIIRHYKNV
jgi:putative endonuclease